MIHKANTLSTLWNNEKGEFILPKGVEIHQAVTTDATGLMKIVSEKTKNQVNLILCTAEDKSKINVSQMIFVTTLSERYQYIDDRTIACFLNTTDTKVRAIKFKCTRYNEYNGPDERDYRLLLKNVKLCFDNRYPQSFEDQPDTFVSKREIPIKEAIEIPFNVATILPEGEKILVTQGNELPPFEDFVQHLLFIAEKKFGIPQERIISKSQKRELVIIRRMCHVISRAVYGSNVSLDKIGFEFGGKDHATVLHSHRQHLNLYETDKEYRNNFIDFNNKIISSLPNWVVIKQKLFWSEILQVFTEQKVGDDSVQKLKQKLLSQLMDIVRFDREYILSLAKQVGIEIKI